MIVIIIIIVFVVIILVFLHNTKGVRRPKPRHVGFLLLLLLF